MMRERTVLACGRSMAVAICVLTGVLAGASGAARADLKVCNTTPSRVGVAVGYQDQRGWATEGWWNVAGNSCTTLLKGAVPSRFIYVHAVDYERGGAWAGDTMMCTAPKSFAIREVENCEQRGYRQTGFYEVDTGSAEDWTVQLSDPDAAKTKGQ